MANLRAVVAQLSQERHRSSQAISALEVVIKNHTGKVARAPKRVLSPAARRRIAVAQKKP